MPDTEQGAGFNDQFTNGLLFGPRLCTLFDTLERANLLQMIYVIHELGVNCGISDAFRGD